MDVFFFYRQQMHNFHYIGIEKHASKTDEITPNLSQYFTTITVWKSRNKEQSKANLKQIKIEQQWNWN